MIKELIIDTNFKLLGVAFSAGDVISLEYSDEASSIIHDDDMSIIEQNEKLAKLKSIYIHDFLIHTRILTIDNSSNWVDLPILTMRDYNLSSINFIDLLNSINSGKVFPEDIELGYKFKNRHENLESNIKPLSSENKQKLIKKIISGYPKYLESLNQDAGKVNFFGHVNEFRTQEDINNESINEYNKLNNNTYLEYIVDDNVFIIEMSIDKVELDNGFSGFDFNKLIYKTNSDYSELEIYTEFKEILMNLLSMSQPDYRENKGSNS